VGWALASLQLDVVSREQRHVPALLLQGTEVRVSIPRIIGVTGYAQHGKDTIAAVLVKEYGYTRVALADRMKEAMLTLDPVIHVGGLTDPPGPFDFERLRNVVKERGWDGAKKHPEVRRLLQVFGTEVGRNMLGEDVWISALARSVKGFYDDHGPRIVIPDIRFLNEAQFIRRMRGDVWRVNRPNFDNGVGTTHASERDIPAIHADATFTNDLDVEYLEAQTRRYVDARGIGLSCRVCGGDDVLSYTRYNRDKPVECRHG
jgi:hypothetical protein